MALFSGDLGDGFKLLQKLLQFSLFTSVKNLHQALDVFDMIGKGFFDFLRPASVIDTR